VRIRIFGFAFFLNVREKAGTSPGAASSVHVPAFIAVEWAAGKLLSSITEFEGSPHGAASRADRVEQVFVAENEIQLPGRVDTD
jgi:hypothetical protein